MPRKEELGGKVVSSQAVTRRRCVAQLDRAFMWRNHACMGVKAHQYTIRNVSPKVHRALRAKALARGVSVNTLLLQLLEAEAGFAAQPKTYDDLDDLIGTWVHDEKVDRALREQRQVDPRDWE